MSTAATTSSTGLTAADLYAMPNEKELELNDGRVIVKDSSFESSRIAARSAMFLCNHCDRLKLGAVLGPDAGYQCFPDDPQRVRKPDVSFIGLAKLSGDTLPAGFIQFTPDLAAEVVSPNDLADEINEKVNQYLAAGITMIWVIYPSSGQVVIFRPSRVKVLSSEDTLSGEEIVPGFELRLSDLFRKPGE